MIKVNEYLEGKVKSLGFELDNTSYTVGVFMPGEYSFSTEQEEHVTVVVGEFKIRLGDEDDWRNIQNGDTIIVPALTKFDLKVNKTAAYKCMYK